MEFKEYSNPLEKDYDINSSLDESNTINNDNIGENPYSKKLIDLVEILEDGEWESYGITLDEYLNPTASTLLKVQSKIKEQNKIGRSR